MRSFWAIIALVSTVGCSFDWDSLRPQAAPGGSATGGMGGVGGSPPPGGMGGGGGAPPGDWSSPSLVEPLASLAYNDDPSFTADLLHVYFNSGRNGGDDLFYATRDAATDDWRPPELLGALASDMFDTDPCVSADGGTIYFTSDRMGPTAVFTSTGQGTAWAAPAQAMGLDMVHAVYWISPDHLTLAVGDGSDIGLATRANTSSAWTVTMIDELNTPDVEDGFIPSDDLLTAIVESDRNGNHDLFETSRDSVVDPWREPTPLTNLSGPADETDPFVSADRRYMMMVLQPAGQEKGIYEASR